MFHDGQRLEENPQSEQNAWKPYSTFPSLLLLRRGTGRVLQIY